jgi:hypothetical protein
MHRNYMPCTVVFHNTQVQLEAARRDAEAAAAALAAEQAARREAESWKPRLDDAQRDLFKLERALELKARDTCCIYNLSELLSLQPCMHACSAECAQVIGGCEFAAAAADANDDYGGQRVLVLLPMSLLPLHRTRSWRPS